MMGVPSTLPDGTAYTMPANPAFRVDSQTGEIFVRDKDNPSAGWIAMQTTSTKRTFVKNTYQNNGSPVDRMGLEFVVEFPQINPIRTQLRLDGAYGYTKYVNEGEACYYPSTSTGGEFYPYVGVYLDNGGSSNVTYNGRKLHALDMNLTAKRLGAALGLRRNIKRFYVDVFARYEHGFGLEYVAQPNRVAATLSVGYNF